MVSAGTPLFGPNDLYCVLSGRVELSLGLPHPEIDGIDSARVRFGREAWKHDPGSTWTRGQHSSAALGRSDTPPMTAGPFPGPSENVRKEPRAGTLSELRRGEPSGLVPRILGNCKTPPSEATFEEVSTRRSEAYSKRSGECFPARSPCRSLPNLYSLLEKV